jgi:hypothetical protein
MVVGVQFHAPATLSSGKDALVLTGYNAKCVPETTTQHLNQETELCGQHIQVSYIYIYTYCHG